MRAPWGLQPLLLLGLLLAAPARASSFDVYCSDNADGTLTCLGWDGGESLTCVSSRGSTVSCSTASGRSFTCVRGLGGVLSCSAAANSGRGVPGPQCVPAGDGTLVCDEEDPPGDPLLPAPGLAPALDPLSAPGLEQLLPGSFTLPSAFD
jgi:hypothetical protein